MNYFGLNDGEYGTYFLLRPSDAKETFEEFYKSVEPAIKKAMELFHEKHGVTTRIAVYGRHRSGDVVISEAVN